jgi:phosphatidate cytidylyltransferase
MHWKRWLTALLAIPILLLVIFKGGPLLFAFLITTVVIVSLWEYFRLVYRNHEPPVSYVFSAWGYLFGVLIIAAAYFQLFLAVCLLLAIHLIGVGYLAILRFGKSTDTIIVAAKQILGITYIPLFLSFLVLIYNNQQGPFWVFFLVWVIGWGDTGALYIGTFTGRHKLCPAVSPKKTIEGAVGGLVTSLISAWIFKLLFFNDLPLISCLMFALIVAIVGQIGDLFASLFKRSSGVKDSGKLLPGHGGLLDRIDALLLAAPIAYLLKEYLLP